MRDTKDISEYIELIAHAKTQDEAISMAESAAKQIGFNWFSIGAEATEPGRLRMVHDRLPAGCYKTYLQAFSGNNPIRSNTLASRMPYVWDAEGIQAESNGVFDATAFGIAWGLSVAVTLADGSPTILTFCSSQMLEKKSHIWPLSGAVLVLATAMVHGLERTGFYGADSLTQADIELLHFLSTPDGANRKKAATILNISYDALVKRMAAIRKILGVETIEEAYIKAAPIIKQNSRKNNK